MKTHHLFISHSWSYHDQYSRLVSLLRERPYFVFSDYSVPKDDPIHNAPDTTALRAAIRAKMAPCGVVLVLAGVYATYSKWIEEEIKLARTDFVTPKPIIAVVPRGSEKTSVSAKARADRIVRWNADSIVDAIRELA